MGKMLLVDDEPEILEVLRVVLQTEGHDITIAGGGDEALEYLKADRFDLLITDVRMKPIDGFELTRRSKALYPDMPVMMVTAFYSSKAKDEAEKLGVIAYVKKPFDVYEVLRTATEALNKDA
jgi:two-component system response regulator PilR (NtrC family)